MVELLIVSLTGLCATQCRMRQSHMYRGTKTRVKTRCVRTDYFEVKMGLHQGSAISPPLFIIIMDVLAEEARPIWAMLFADDFVLVSETVEEELERWRAVIENKGIIISRSETDYLVSSHQQDVVRLEGEPLLSVNSFKYLGSVIDGSGGCGNDVDGGIKVAWSRWGIYLELLMIRRYP